MLASSFIKFSYKGWFLRSYITATIRYFWEFGFIYSGVHHGRWQRRKLCYLVQFRF